MNDYMERISDEKLRLLLKAKGAVLIEGPKWCGKTRSAEKHANSVLFMQDPDMQEQHIDTAKTKPSILLRGETPRLIDEWQDAPILWNAVRHEVDKRGKRGQFILTGSVIPERTDNMHTGTGRIARMKMWPMSLYESNDSTGDISLKDLFAGNYNADNTGLCEKTLEEYAYLLNRGGWPEAVLEENRKLSVLIARDYLESVINEDISRADGVYKNPDRVRALMRSLSRNISSEAKNTTIQNDLAMNDEELSKATVEQYIKALRKIFVVDDLPAWSAKLRSKTAMRTSDKRHFIDPSIAAASMGASVERLMSDFNTFGFLFESLAVRDLRVYADSIDGRVYHYRDRTGFEVDAIIELFDGRWGACEIKMGAGYIDEAAECLLKLKKKIDTEKMNEPSFLAVITATKYAFQMENGVWVVPLGCLKP